jgi:GntR family histidine utilization transcriptional repressor
MNRGPTTAGGGRRLSNSNAMTTPIYQEIKDFILARIHSGEWAEGDQVPSENELAREFNVARMTVNRALRELTAEQVLTRTRGSGTYVASPKYESTLVAIRSISDEVAARGHAYHAQVLEVGAAVADAALADELQLDTGSPIFHSRVLHFENDTPVQLEERWVNPACAPEYALQDFTATTPNQYLTRVAPLQRVEYRIEAALPDAQTRRHLTMDEREPCLLLHRRTWSQGSSRRSRICGIPAAAIGSPGISEHARAARCPVCALHNRFVTTNAVSACQISRAAVC